MNNEIGIVLTALAIYVAGAVSPGPDLTLIVRLVASGERLAAFGATLGFSVGAAGYATLAMTGFALVITQVSWLMNAIHIAGGCYLVYFGFSAWFARPSGSDVPFARPAAKGFWRGLRIGLVVELANPQSIAFFASIFAVVIPAETSLWAKSSILFGGFMVDLVWFGLAATTLSMRSVRKFYKKHAFGIVRVLGTVLAGFGLRMIVAKL